MKIVVGQDKHKPLLLATGVFSRFLAKAKQLLPKLDPQLVQIRLRIHREGRARQFAGSMVAALPHELLTVQVASPTLHGAVAQATKRMIERIKQYKDLHFSYRNTHRNKRAAQKRHFNFSWAS